MADIPSSEDCPCCHKELKPGLDTERAFVIAFLCGLRAKSTNLDVAEMLCKLHAPIALEFQIFASAAGVALTERPKAEEAGEAAKPTPPAIIRALDEELRPLGDMIAQKLVGGTDFIIILTRSTGSDAKENVYLSTLPKGQTGHLLESLGRIVSARAREQRKAGAH